jgi:hypothetical protein
MTDKTIPPICEKLTDLAARVEAAEAHAQFEHLLLAWEAVHGDRLAVLAQSDFAIEQWTYARRCFVDLLTSGGYIDAALTLVPEGCGWVAGYGQVRSDEPLGGAQITRHAKFAGYDVANDVIAEAEAATPALALCAAALRARTTLSTMKAADHDNS